MKPYYFLLILPLTACAPSPAWHVPDTGAPALHAITDHHLRELMWRMNSLMLERFMTETELDRMRRASTLRMAQAAGHLDQTIDAIVATLPGLRLDEPRQGLFLTLADKLREQVRSLQAQAEQNHIDTIPKTLEHITTTCTACHALFRSARL